MTSWNVLLKLEDLPTYLLTKIMFFSVSTDQKGLSSKKTGVQGHGLEGWSVNKGHLLMVLKFTHPGSSRPHHPSFPDFLIDFGAPPKNKSCHASFPSSIYMPKSGRKFSWIKPADFRDSTFFWMSIKWMTNLPPLFCHNKKTQKRKSFKNVS